MQRAGERIVLFNRGRVRSGRGDIVADRYPVVDSYTVFHGRNAHLPGRAQQLLAAGEDRRNARSHAEQLPCDLGVDVADGAAFMSCQKAVVLGLLLPCGRACAMRCFRGAVCAPCDAGKGLRRDPRIGYLLVVHNHRARCRHAAVRIRDRDAGRLRVIDIGHKGSSDAPVRAQGRHPDAAAVVKRLDLADIFPGVRPVGQCDKRLVPCLVEIKRPGRDVTLECRYVDLPGLIEIA